MKKTNFDNGSKFMRETYREDGLYLNTDENNNIELIVVSKTDGVGVFMEGQVDIVLASIEEEKQKAIEGYMNTHTSTPKAEAAIVSTKSPQGLVSEEFVLNLVNAIKG